MFKIVDNPWKVKALDGVSQIRLGSIATVLASRDAFAEGAQYQACADARELEPILDDLNCRLGSSKELCLFCHSKEHNATVGIVHKEGCLILQLRQAIKKTADGGMMITEKEIGAGR